MNGWVVNGTINGVPTHGKGVRVTYGNRRTADHEERTSRYPGKEERPEDGAWQQKLRDYVAYLSILLKDCSMDTTPDMFTFTIRPEKTPEAFANAWSRSRNAISNAFIEISKPDGAFKNMRLPKDGREWVQVTVGGIKLLREELKGSGVEFHVEQFLTTVELRNAAYGTAEDRERRKAALRKLREELGIETTTTSSQKVEKNGGKGGWALFDTS